MEVRCKKCNRLLFKVKKPGCVVDVKCPKCGHTQTITIAAKKKTGDAPAKGK
jgi:phage FluMu protein Com